VSDAHVLLISGSRSLADVFESEQWARRLVRETIAELPRGSLVVCGDACGPDAYAAEYAKLRRLALHQFCLDGWVQGDGSPFMWWTKPVPPRHDPARRRWPLVRNERMVRWAATHELNTGRFALRKILALVDPTSATRGTGHTARLAREAGLVGEPVEWRT
jgi:hypothetical protein